MLDAAQSILAAPVERLFDLRDPFSLASLVGAMFVAVLLYGMRPGRSVIRRLKALGRAALDRRILLHRSSLLDYKLFFVTSFIYATGWIAAITSSEWVRDGVMTVLVMLAPAAPSEAPGWGIVALVTVAFVLVYELNYWFAHWLMHRFQPMWAFHKLHHSAEVMTPMTEWRQHPVELLLFPACHAIGLGTFYALVTWGFGSQAAMFTLFETNIILVALTFTVLHLRHTHLWIPLRGWLGCLIQSPAHHQIHHSTDPAHFGKNLGLCLSIWDWAFGTLCIPDERGAIRFGVEGCVHTSVRAAFAEPFAALVPPSPENRGVAAPEKLSA